MRSTKLTAISAAALFAFSMAACSNSSKTDGSTAAAAPTMAPATTTEAPAPSPSMAAATFGAGCSAVPTDPSNKGSFEAMAQVPVATAASGNPLLKTLVAAVGKAGLGDSLNSASALTVFAPVDSAFKKIPPAALNKILANQKQLGDLLKYHVVPGKLTPADLAGPHKTLQGGEVTVTGSGSNFKVNGTSTVICGNVQTANATVYLLDTVLTPKA